MNSIYKQGEEHLSMKEIRPRFRIESSDKMDELIRKLKEGLENPAAPCQGKVIHGHATLSPLQSEQHYWSPQLGLSIEETENGTLLRGLYGPRPEVWTLFVLFYSVIGLAGLVVLIIGMSKLTLGKSADILWLVPILGTIFLTLFLVANRGKNLGKDQIKILHNFLEKCTGLDVS
ncbi:MAG: hypothetical protein JXR07_04390 [Reichenbachiella sp.]